MDLAELFYKYDIPMGFEPEYGTAGFRYNADKLDGIVFRCGVLMGIHSLLKEKNNGIMITASHNPESDNGVKLIGQNGEMIGDRWKTRMNELMKCKTFDMFKTYIQSLLSEKKNVYVKRHVFIGVDTRPSGKRLALICEAGVQSVGGKAVNLGYLTTPELHYYVFHSNHKVLPKFIRYSKNLIKTFSNLIQGKYNKNKVDIHVDCANGVGSLVMTEMKKPLYSMGINLILYNSCNGSLNHLCGADYVEKEHNFPDNMENVPEYSLCCSIDGDADRIVFFTKQNGAFKLLNGDKIACLFARYISEKDKHAIIGVIQTAYSNGASTKYIKRNFPDIVVKCTNTGVENLHKEAKKYDIGIYFEANGHGTVLFNEKYRNVCSSTEIQGLSNILNQWTGCGIANMLAVLYVLKSFGWTNWVNMYDDLYTKQVKLFVDKNKFQTVDYGRFCIKPLGLQELMNNILNKYTGSRAFIRPSGTEDLVRLYVECENERDLGHITTSIKNAVYDIIEV